MFVSIVHNEGQYPSFDIRLHNAEGAEPFLSVKKCKIIDGKNGPFVSYPARKDDKGKYWPHVYGGEKFNEHVLKLAQADKPKPAKPTRPAYPPAGPDVGDGDNIPPF